MQTHFCFSFSFSFRFRLQTTTSLSLPILRHITTHSKQSKLPRFPLNPLREDPTALQQRLLRPPPRHPFLPVVVGVTPRHRHQRPRRLLFRRRQLRHRLPPGHRLRRVIQPHTMVPHRLRRRRRGQGHVQRGTGWVDFLGSQCQRL